MDRIRFTRRALARGLAVAIVATSMRNTRVLAQDDDDNTYYIEYDGQLMSAGREFAARGLRLEGALRYNFTVLQYGEAGDARAAFDDLKANFLDDYGTAGKISFTDTAEVSTPDVGEDRYGQVTKTTVDGTELSFAFLYVIDGIFVHVWGGLGLAESFVELSGLAEHWFTRSPVTPVAEAGTPVAYAEILSRLPTLHDMPSGFTLTMEQVKVP